MADPTRHFPDGSFPTGDPAPAADTHSYGAPAGAVVGPPAAPAGYELLEEIGRGGMGVVYRGRDTALSRDVAVKFLRREYPAASLAGRRFVDEARITGQLQHPGIPPVHEVGELPDGRPFLVMKLIKGRTLADTLASGRGPSTRTAPGPGQADGPASEGRPPPEMSHGALVAAFEQVCQAVAYAHNHGVVHRDLKPQNVMVGAFGEVQVMDWGLAKFRADTRAESPEALTASTFHDPRADADDLQTRAGAFVGTPAYMSPEQAIGAVELIDERSDVFGLGALLCAILTGGPPFVAATTETTRHLAAQKKVAPAFARLDACGAEPELVALCKRCLAGEREERLRNGGEVAAAVRAIRAGVEERARLAELEAVRLEGERQKADLRAVEQQKRRRVQLALFAAVLLLIVGGGAAMWWQDRQATARKAERVRDEEKRKGDLQAADAEARERQRVAQREAKAAALARALAVAEPGAVPVLLKELAEYRDEARPHVRALADRPIEQRAGLHGRFAVLADPKLGPDDVFAIQMDVSTYALTSPRTDELPLILDQLTSPYNQTLAKVLWNLSNSPRIDPAFRALRGGAVLARLDPGSPNWTRHADSIAEQLVRCNPLEVEPFAEALRPVRGHLLPSLLKRYPESRARIESGKLPISELVAEASAFDLTANLLARYAADRPVELAELAVTVDGRHFPLFADALRQNRAAVAPALKAELAKKPPEGRADAAHDALAKRRGHAAAALVAMEEPDAAWPVFAFPKDGDPGARSYLLQRLAAIGADPAVLVRRFGTEADVSAKRALLVALGDFPAEQLRVAERDAFVARLLVAYRDDPDPGIHSAIDWLLRQKWGKAQELATIDAELAATARGRVAARGLTAVVLPQPVGTVVGPLLPAPAVVRGKDWFVNCEGQTFAVVREPAEFTLGSPDAEPGRSALNEPPHRKRIGRTFAVATKEVTNAEFKRFLPKHAWVERYSPGPDTPAVSVTWYECAAYCNWLSAREGIPRDQWCYAPNKDGAYAEGMTARPGHLSLAGYRLPTEAEWEYACRAGSVVARPFGRGEELLPRYAWYVKNADDRTWPAGQLRPNDLGLFDVLGNACEWVEDPGGPYLNTGQLEDKENGELMVIEERPSRLVRGSGFMYQPVDVRSAYRTNGFQPSNIGGTAGFRPVRTLTGE